MKEDQVKRAFALRRKIAFYGTAKNGYMDSGLWEFLPYVRTFDEHDSVNPIKPLPTDPDGKIKEYILQVCLAYLKNDRLLVSKSRQIMMSWIFCAIACWVARTGHKRKIVWQSFKEDEAANMVCLGKDDPQSARMSFIETNLTNPNGTIASWLIDPRIASGKGMSFNRLLYQNNSVIEGIPQGGGQIRSKVPTVAFLDEGAFQPEFSQSIQAATFCCQKIVGLSSANPGGFGDLVCGYEGYEDKKEPPVHLYKENEVLPKGMRVWKVGEWSVLDVSYAADPEKDPDRIGKEWYDREVARAGGFDSVKWQQEMERNYRVTGGDPVFPFATKKSPILIRPLKVEEYKKDWWLCAGLDYGVRDLSYIVVWAIDKDFKAHAIWEYGASGQKAHYKKFVADVARTCPYWQQIQNKIVADGTLWTENQQQDSSIKMLAHMIESEMRVWGGGGLIKGNKGSPSADVRIAEMFKGDYWNNPEAPTAFITTLCPLQWESVQNIRWEQFASAKSRDSNAPALKIKHKYSDQWDATSYVFDKLRPHFRQEKQEIRKGTPAYVLQQARRKQRATRRRSTRRRSGRAVA